MDLKLERSNTTNNISTKILGDLGNIQITDDSDCDEKNCEKKVVRTLTKPSIPPNLIQNTLPIIGSVTVTNSDNVQFGSNTYFNGPVTIKQVIQNKSGVDNAAFINTEGDSDTNAQHPHKGKITDITKKEQLLLWHKILFSAICITIIGSVIAIVLVLQNKTDQTGSAPQKDYKLADSSTDTTVVGYGFENFQLILILTIVLPLILTILFFLLTKNVVDNESVSVVNQNQIQYNSITNYGMQQMIRDNPLLIAPDHLRIVSRDDWLAQPVEKPITNLTLPAPWVIITHTATEGCYTQSQCVLRVRLMQMYHIESRGWSDIAYNFLVGGDGSVYFGRGWDYEGAHTKGYNKYSIAIAFIGTFTANPPPRRQVEACQKIIKQGVELGKLSKDYKLFAHRQLMSTKSPGEKVYDIIKTWPHFVTNLNDTAALMPNS